MKVVIAGGTGFVGKALVQDLLKKQHEVYVLTRNANKPSHDPNLHYVEWLKENASPENVIQKADAFINLAGVSLNSGRWTEERKQAIVQSRISSTREIIRIMESLEVKPSAYINASAVGYYGTAEQDTFTETSPSVGHDFLAETVKVWEAEAARAEDLGIRTVFTRFGVILGKDGGALSMIALPYRFFAGGTVGSGNQWLSWVHIKDVVEIIQFAIVNPGVQGPVNVTAPTPVQMKEFGQTVGAVLHRPHWLPAPSFGLKLMLGEMSMIILEGQHVIPEKMIQHNYHFTYTKLEDALQDLL